MLYEALQYSGLVTPDMTYEEMCEVLAERFPAQPTLTLYAWGGPAKTGSVWTADKSGLYMAITPSSAGANGSSTGTTLFSNNYCVFANLDSGQKISLVGTGDTSNNSLFAVCFYLGDKVKAVTQKTFSTSATYTVPASDTTNTKIAFTMGRGSTYANTYVSDGSLKSLTGTKSGTDGGGTTYKNRYTVVAHKTNSEYTISSSVSGFASQIIGYFELSE